MIVDELYTYISSNFTDFDVFFVSAEAESVKPYAVMLPVDDPEQNFVMCLEQGEEGDLLLQFSGVAESNAYCYGIMNKLKEFISSLKGIILPSYMIWSNLTEGVKMVQESSLNVWTGLFETQLKWTKRS